MNRKLYYLLIFLFLNSFSISSYAQLYGTYTIGPSVSTNYKTITQAVMDLYFNGVAGAVTFNIENGVYNEQVYVPFITSSSPSRLITFQSQSGDSSKVIIKFKPTGDSLNYTLMLDGGSNLVFKKLTFTTDTIFGRVIDINNNCTHNQFFNNRIIGMKDSKELVYSKDTTGSIDNYNKFINNLFQYGSIGISFAGADNTYSEIGTEITNNKFFDQSQIGIALKYSNDFKVRNNTISSSLGLYDYTGIKIQQCKDKFWVEKNKIDISNQSQTGHGISVINSYGNSTANASSISNNFIHIYSNVFVYVSGIEILGSFKNFYYNSVNLTGENVNSFGFNEITASDINIVNNIFSNQALGLTMNLNDTTNINSDYNDLFTNGTDITSGVMNYYSTLVSWSAAIKKDLHSISTDPLFFSTNDLHTKNFRLSKKGKTVGVSDDFDGNVRKSPKPDIGADEFNYKFDLGADRYICAGSSSTISSEQGFDSYLWSNGDTNSSITFDSTGIGLGIKKVKVTVTYEGNIFSDSILINFIVASASIGPDKSVCEFEQVTLNATGGVIFKWNTGDTLSIINFTANQSSKFSVTVTDQYGCVDSASIWINVNPRPATPTIIQVGSDTLKSTVMGSSYTWFQNKTKLNDKTISIKALVNGAYRLIVWDSACHSDTSAGYDFIKNSLDNFQSKAQMRFYPNPANNILIVEISNFFISNTELEIVSVLGKQVYYSDHLYPKNEINVSFIPKGLYFIKLITDGQILVERFVVQ